MTTTMYARLRCNDGCEHDLVAAPGEVYTTEIDGRSYVLRIRKFRGEDIPDLMELIPAGPIHVGTLVAGPSEEPIA